ncbi:type VII secretion protein EsaA [Streptococcus acidominimus]|uniref:Type VII secretion system accessory factor EsaA n=1 Tax=Streptococcus acidominimus TaxID=1326 RepID=A0A4Y9FQ22_STRAI|nr:type VII secretion protein EsaA [Streptococcus acidominimus]MBF0818417.1 type VII secretion protein EsaA [Streptococcus acidominimus]MBF0838606.1 type VII secretion protein EsaA [Streptococcus acidominimus]MBF0846375.1 type VII secretion protein EsaA [Streptococcus danieliae]TFU31324.1 type VII secretion protein EsaA [Streptococcus acidominimus]
MNKKRLTWLGVALLAMTIVISFLGVIKPTPISKTSSEQTVQKSPLKIAVVNEDKGTNYNGENVHIADTLLKSLATSTDYDIETVSRSIATKGLENNTYQLMIIFPSKFSEESLALESTNPSRAVFQYEIKSDKQLVVKQAEQAVIDFKSLFNKDLVNIYFLSIIGNLQTAQSQVSDLVTNEGSALDTYNTKLVNPLISYSQLFAGLGSRPNDLVNTYSTFSKELNHTNDAFTSIVSVDKSYEDEIEKIKSLQESWQSSIDARETTLHNYDEAFSKLTVEQELGQMKALNTYILEHLSEPEVWKDTRDKVNGFNTELSSFVARLRKLNTDIDTTLANYEKTIATAVEESLNDTSGQADKTEEIKQTLGLYFKTLHDTMLSKMDGTIATTHFYTDTTIDSMGLSDADKAYLKTINRFVEWYAEKNEKPLPTTRTATFQQEHLAEVKKAALQQLQTQRSISFSDLEGNITSVHLFVPANYRVNVSNYPVSQVSDTEYTISGLSGTSFTILYNLEVLNPEQMDIFQDVPVRAVVKTSQEVEALSGEQEEKKVPVKVTVPADAEKPDAKPQEIEVETTVSIPKAETKNIARTYSYTDVIPNVSAYAVSQGGQAVYNDVKGYIEVASLAAAFYDMDLQSGKVEPGPSALLSQTDTENLKAIIVQLIKDATISSLKEQLKVPEQDLEQFEAKMTNAEGLVKNIEALRTNTSDLLVKLGATLQETEKVHESIQNKPVFTETEKRENTGLVTVTMDINKDLSRLMAASQTLMNNTKSNQSVSKTIESDVEKLSTDVANLEKEGESLSGRVTELKTVMDTTYNSNKDFLQAFSSVLSNTKTGNSKNEAVYDYLSNPVDASNIQNVLKTTAVTKVTTARQDERSGLLIMLICYLVALGIAYLLQHADIAGLQQRLKITNRIHWKNATGPMTFLTGMGAIAGFLIAAIAGYKLDMSVGQIVAFIFLLVLITLCCTYAINVMLEKLRSLGFLVGIVLLLLYLVTAGQLLDAHYVSSAHFLDTLSPLSHLEKLVTNFINHTQGWELATVLVFFVTIVLGTTNILIYRKVKER